MKEITKTYTNGEVTIVWKPHVCIHSTVCWKGEAALPEVFNPFEKPWIKPLGADTQRIIDQVKKCPSGALSYYMNNETAKQQESSVESIVEPSLNGPLMVYGNILVKHSDGTEAKREKVTAFCRCGASSNKPYCDGTHGKIDFKG